MSILETNVLVGFSGPLFELLYDKDSQYKLMILEDNISIRNKIKSLNIKIQPIKTFKEFLAKDLSCKSNLFIGVASNPILRSKIISKFNSVSNEFPKLIDPSVIKSNYCKLGKGIFIDKYVTIEFNTTISDYAYVNSHSHIGHDSVIGKNTIIGGSVVINGGAHVGECSLIGSKSVVSNNVKIGKNCLIQAGSVVLKDIPDNHFASGNPCQVNCPISLIWRDVP
ncbi:hypothetical protein CL656_04935 [bacterium]|nr:hypothetical protein [bacterium]|tara:strand:- start:50 stop:721 length:672 start_codon:yes stop_codon:yes gene_type:complete